MADFMAGETAFNGKTNGESASHSRQSSMSSGRSERSDKHNSQPTGGDSRRYSDDGDVSSQQLFLKDGAQLTGESRTEVSGLFNPGYNGMKNGDGDSGRHQSTGGGTGTARHKVSKSGTLVSSIPEKEIIIPGDGNLVAFTADDMATFLRYLRLDDRLVNHLHRSGLDGRKFGRLKDSDLESLQLKNPIVIYFRDKTAPAANKKPKARLPFVL